jgi:hypothetical protein
MVEVAFAKYLKCLNLVRSAHNWPALARHENNNRCHVKTQSGPGNNKMLEYWNIGLRGMKTIRK